MRESSESPVAYVARRMRGSPLHLSAIHCTNSKHACVARALWPLKTAEHWAAKADVQPRMAKYWLAGSHAVSADGKLALIRELD